MMTALLFTERRKRSEIKASTRHEPVEVFLDEWDCLTGPGTCVTCPLSSINEASTLDAAKSARSAWGDDMAANSVREQGKACVARRRVNIVDQRLRSCVSARKYLHVWLTRSINDVRHIRC